MALYYRNSFFCFVFMCSFCVKIEQVQRCPARRACIHLVTVFMFFVFVLFQRDSRFSELIYNPSTVMKTSTSGEPWKITEQIVTKKKWKKKPISFLKPILPTIPVDAWVEICFDANHHSRWSRAFRKDHKIRRRYTHTHPHTPTHTHPHMRDPLVFGMRV